MKSSRARRCDPCCLDAVCVYIVEQGKSVGYDDVQRERDIPRAGLEYCRRSDGWR